jgi:biotin carboxylase
VHRVLIVGGGSELQPRLRKIRDDLETVVICRASVLSFVHELGENRAVVVLNDATALEGWVAAAQAVAAQWPVDRVASFAEIDQDRAAAIAAALGLPFHTAETVLRVHDKNAMRRCLTRAGLEELPHRIVGDVAEVEGFAAEVGLPLVLKPNRGRASAGIAVVRNADEISDAFARASGAAAPRLEPSPVLAERFVEGREYSVEALSHEGHHYVFAVTDKRKDDATKVELGHVVPAALDRGTEGALLRHVRAALSALGVREGITHTEVIVTAEGPVLVETHLRWAGDSIPELVSDASGVDMIDLMLRQVAGEDVARTPELLARTEHPVYVAGAAISYLAPNVSGVLDCIDGWDEVKALDGVRDCAQDRPDGTVLDGLHSSYSRLGHVRIRAASAAEAVALADQAVDSLRLRLRHENVQ